MVVFQFLTKDRMMTILSIESFLPYLEPFGNKELLSPTESSRIQLMLAELLIDNTVDLPLLKFLSRFLSNQAYNDIVEEKNIEHQCGYLVCNNSPKERVQRAYDRLNGSTPDHGLVASTKYQIYNRRPSMILPNTYLSQYCCKEHYQASVFYQNQLSQEALFARKDILTTQPFPRECPPTWYENGITCLEEVLEKHKEIKEQGKSLQDAVMMMSNMKIDSGNYDTNELMSLIDNLKIVEKEGGLEGDDPEDSSNDGDDNVNDHVTGTHLNCGNTVI